MVTGQQPLTQRQLGQGADRGLQEMGGGLSDLKHGPRYSEESTTAPPPPQEVEKVWHGLSNPQKVLQLHQ